MLALHVAAVANHNQDPPRALGLSGVHHFILARAIYGVIKSLPTPCLQPENLFVQEFSVAGEILDNRTGSIERLQENLVLCVPPLQYAEDEFGRRVLFEAELAARTVAGVQHDPNAEWLVGLLAEVADGLGPPVFVDLKIILRQVDDGETALANDDHRDVHYFDPHANLVFACREAGLVRPSGSLQSRVVAAGHR